jgi:hypothetical protein
MNEDNTAPAQPQTIYVQQAPAAPSNGMAIASLVLGIISVVFVWIPVLGMIAWVTSPLGLIFGALAMRKPTHRGMAIAGLVCSVVGLVICLCWGLIFGAAISAAASEGALNH